MIREFDDSGSWIWAVYGVIYAAMLAVGIFMGSRQSIFALYLPLDILICAGLAYFYFRLKGKEEEKKKEQERLEKIVKDKLSGGIAKLMKVQMAKTAASVENPDEHEEQKQEEENL